MKPFLFTVGQAVVCVASQWRSMETGQPAQAKHTMPVLDTVYHVQGMDVGPGGRNYIWLLEMPLNYQGGEFKFAETKFAPADAELTALVEELVREEEVLA